MEIAYNGTPYSGWQVQPNAPTIQEHINKALTLITREEIYVVGCGRTDAKVHAKKYFLHFDMKGEPQENLLFKLNRYLGEDIAVRRIMPMHENAHSRYDATARTYNYHIHLREDPFLQGLSYFYFKPVDIELMQRACGLLLEYKDFAPLSKFNADNKTTFCDIMDAAWEYDEENQRLMFRITANRFLWNMVRLTVGAMLMIGEGKISLEEFDKTMREAGTFKYIRAAPPQGLYLVDIKYPYL